MLDQGALAGGVALVHRPDLRDRDVGLVDHDEEVVREVVEQTVRRLPGHPAVDVPGVVLDAAAEADLLHHLEVERGAHPQPLRLEQLALPFQLGQPFGQLLADGADGAFHRRGAGGVVRGRETPTRRPWC